MWQKSTWRRYEWEMRKRVTDMQNQLRDEYPLQATWILVSEVQYLSMAVTIFTDQADTLP